MSAITLSDAKSQQLLAKTSNWAQLTSYETTGEVNVRGWEFNTTDDLNGATLAGDQSYALIPLYAGETILSIAGVNGAMGSGRVVDFGLAAVDGSGIIDDENSTADDIDLLVDGQAVATAGQFSLLPLTGAYRVKKDCYLVATATGSAWAAGQDLDGYVLIAKAP